MAPSNFTEVDLLLASSHFQEIAAYAMRAVNMDVSFTALAKMTPLRPYLLDAARSAGSYARKLLRQTVSTWETDIISDAASTEGKVTKVNRKPTFNEIGVSSSGRIAPKMFTREQMASGEGVSLVKVGTKSVLYLWVNSGTAPHTIKRTSGGDEPGDKYLKFPSYSTPKTFPGSLFSTEGNPVPDGFTRKESVKHPGVEARNFVDPIVLKATKVYHEKAREAVEKALKKYREAAKKITLRGK